VSRRRQTTRYVKQKECHMDIEKIDGFTLKNIALVNVVLGKNGCGKSYLLRQLEKTLRGSPDYGIVKYLSPERGGLLQYEANIEQNVAANVNWLAETRRHNQASQFRQQSAAQFRRLEIFFLRDIEKKLDLRADPKITFDTTVDRINSLLERISIQRADPAFQIVERRSANAVAPQEISSGESELISLSIECLMFQKECHTDKPNLLLFDEPDVHLHPDLQARFAFFLLNQFKQPSCSIIIATHSTALLSALSHNDDTRVAFMRFGDTEITFSPVSDAHRRVLPVFGAHPLSNVFNEVPVLLLEGDDDERVWQQAIRSSRGKIRAYPCAVDGIDQLNSYEKEVSKIIQAVYDNAVGYSIRDRDDMPEDIGDIPPIRRMRLSCRNIENLLLSDEVLTMLGTSWETLRERIDSWLAKNPEHPHYAMMKAFSEVGYDRKQADVKELRIDLVALLGTNKPWEVLIGQAIASIVGVQPSISPTSLSAFLGPRVVSELLQQRIAAA